MADNLADLLRTKLGFEDDSVDYALSMLLDEDLIETDEDRLESVKTLMEDEPTEEQRGSVRM
jgi:hypothetical protein